MSTIVTRAGKGSPLTNAEVDANFTNLNTDKYEFGSAAFFTTGLVGTTASFTDFPNAKFIGSQANTGSAHIYNIGVAGEGVATDVVGAGQWGVGVYGTGATAGATRGIGVVGDGHVSDTADTAAAIGVRGYATGTHAGGQNIGLYAQATGGASNYALFMASGNIYSAVVQTWAIPDNTANALSFDTTGKAGILAITTTDGAETVTMSGKLSVTGAATLGNGAVLGTPASGNFSTGTFTWPTFNQNTTGSSGSTTGNAATATTLQTARTINGTSFDGSANITITAAATNVNTQLASLGVGTAASGTAGEIRATNNVTAYYSDARLKTKIGDIESPLAKVRQIETMLYHANETAVALGYDASIVEVGVSAQSVQKVQPEAVAPAPIDDKYLTVRYERLVPLLIEAIKELDAVVAKLVD